MDSNSLQNSLVMMDVGVGLMLMLAFVTKMGAPIGYLASVLIGGAFLIGGFALRLGYRKSGFTAFIILLLTGVGMMLASAP